MHPGFIAVGALLLWFAQPAFAVESSAGTDEYRSKVLEQLIDAEEYRFELERMMGDAETAINEATENESKAQAAWKDCSKRKGIRSMDPYVAGLARQRRIADAAREEIEVRRRELWDDRVALEVVRKAIERRPRDLEYSRRLMDEYIEPMRRILASMEDVISGYSDYVATSTNRQAVFIEAKARHCEGHTSLLQHLMNGLAAVVVSTKRLVSVVGSLRRSSMTAAGSDVVRP